MNDLDTLFYKIRYFGYENEFPFGPGDDAREAIAERACERGNGELNDLFEHHYPTSTYEPHFRSHVECGGTEMYNSKPAPSFEELQNVIATIYSFVDNMVGEDVGRTEQLRDILSDFYSTRDAYDNYWDDYENIEGAFDKAQEMKSQKYPLWEDDGFLDFMNNKYSSEDGLNIPNYMENPKQLEYDWNEYWDERADDDYMDAITSPGYYRFRNYHMDIDRDDYFFSNRSDYNILRNYDLFDERVDLDDYEIQDDEDSVYVDEYYLNGDEVGVHIRIDVSDWNDVSILRYVRLFSKEFSDARYLSYVRWMESYFGRGWSNYNSPIDYETYYGVYKRLRNSGFSSDDTARFNQPSKSYNISTEHGTFGDGVITLEMRAFGVNENLHDALRQADLVKHLCRVVKHSFDTKFDSLSVIDQLHGAWLDLKERGLIE